MTTRKNRPREALGPDQPQFLHELLDFLTGKEPWPDWRDWWMRNRVEVEMHLDAREPEDLRCDPDRGVMILYRR